MDKKEYTTGSTCSYDFKYDISDKINWPQGDWYKDWNNFNWCQYLLPCGLCEKTMQNCPKYKPNQIFITFDNKTGGNIND